MRIRTKLAILLSPPLVVAMIGLMAHFACGCADIAYVPSAVDELPPEVLAAARDAKPGVIFSQALKMVENKTHVLEYRLEGRDTSGVRFEVVVHSDRRTQVSELADASPLEPVVPPAHPSSAGR